MERRLCNCIPSSTIIIVDIAAVVIPRPSRVVVGLIRASKFRCTSCMQQGAEIDALWSPHCDIYGNSICEPCLIVEMFACLPACPIVAASQFPCIMPPHCCRFRFQTRFKMTTFGETALSSCPKSFQVTINLGSFFSHAISPLFSPSTP